jgi:hypothetical protein
MLYPRGKDYLEKHKIRENYRGILNKGQQLLKSATSMGSRVSGSIKDRILKTVDFTRSREKFGSERENALIKSGN